MAVISCRRSAAGGRSGWMFCGGGGACRRCCRGRGADGDVDRGDDGDGVGSPVAVVEVAGGGAFDLAGAEAGPAGGQQGGQDGAADDADQIGRAVWADALGADLMSDCGQAAEQRVPLLFTLERCSG